MADPGPSRLFQRLDGFLFAGLLLLIALVLRDPDVKLAWRAALLLFGVLSIGGWLVCRYFHWGDLHPTLRRMMFTAIVFVVIVVIASLSGSTLRLAPEQFFLGFLLPLLIPWLFVNHVRDRRRWEWVMATFVFAASLLLARNFAQYVQELIVLGKIPEDIHLHRRFAVKLVFGLPFLLWFALASRQRWVAMVGWALTILSMLMILATGSRGAWLGTIVVVLIFLGFLRSRRLLLGFFVGMAIVVIAGLAIIPSELVQNRIQQGMDTSNRTSGTWGPAVEMIRDRPLLGYGLGDDVFHEEFNRRSAMAEHWTIKKSIGPHSFFLALGFAAGLPALLILLILLGQTVWLVGRGAQSGVVAGGSDRSFALSGVALTAAALGAYGVIGNVENLNWILLWFWLGMSMVWLKLAASSSEP